MNEELFRKKSLDKVKSPDKLNDYVRVTTPALWLVLIGVIALFAGAFVWASIYNVEVRTSTSVVVNNNRASLKLKDSDFSKVQTGMYVYVETEKAVVESIDTNEKTVYTTLNLTDGNYSGYIVTGTIHPISYLFN